MNKLSDLIQEALNSRFAVATYCNVTVEINGGVPIYYVNEEECTASVAIEELEK